MLLGKFQSDDFERNIQRRKLLEKKILLNFEKELEKARENQKRGLDNTKIKFKRGVGYTLKTVRRIYPYLIPPALTLGLLSLFGIIPFNDDGQKEYRKVKTSTDSFGNVSYEKQYDSFKNDDDYIEYVCPWVPVGDDNYERLIYVYDVEKYDVEEIMTAIENPTVSYLNETFGEYNTAKVEYSNNLSDEEKQIGAHVQTVVFTKDKEDYKITHFGPIENFFSILFLVVITGAGDFFVFDYRTEASYFNYGNEIFKIKEKYPYYSEEVVKKKLDIAQDNVRKLKGE